MPAGHVVVQINLSVFQNPAGLSAQSASSFHTMKNIPLSIIISFVVWLLCHPSVIASDDGTAKTESALPYAINIKALEGAPKVATGTAPFSKDMPPLLWSDPATWGGRLPADREDIIIPSGLRVLLDLNTPSLSSLLIQGELIFDNNDLSLTSDWIMVQGHGARLQIGTEAKPFGRKAVITLTGSDEDEHVFGIDGSARRTKFLMATNGGMLDFHGVSRNKINWTHLGNYATFGDTAITVADRVDWQPGDKIVIAASSFNPYEAEEVTVMAVDGTQVRIAPALQYQHLGMLQADKPRTLNPQAEVGLLTHNIVIQGAEDSLDSNFGGHVLIMPDAVAQIEGVEFFRMGQMDHVARYPLYWQTVGSVEIGAKPIVDQYARNNSIHGSFHRAIVVQSQISVIVESNVAYDVWSDTFVSVAEDHETVSHFPNNLTILPKGWISLSQSFPWEEMVSIAE